MKTIDLPITEINEWIPLANPDYGLGIKNMGEYNQGAEWAKIIISKKDDNNFINFGDIAFASYPSNDFFIQSPNGSFICCQWMFHKVHMHVAPVIFNIVNRTFCIIDATRILRPLKIWSIEDIIYGEFSETVWIESKRHEKRANLKILKKFESIDSLFSLNPNDLKVGIYKWTDGVLNISTE